MAETNLPPSRSLNTNQTCESLFVDGVVTPTLVKCMEAAECIHVSEQTKACRVLFPEENIQIHEIEGATVPLTSAKLGLKLNFVVGLGSRGPVTEDVVERIERVYSDAGLSTLVDLCPHADKNIISTLAARGFHVVTFLNAYVRSLADLPITHDLEARLSQSQKDQGMTISYVGEDDEEAFTQCSLEGFRETGRSPELLSTLARVAIKRPDTLRYMLKIHGQVVTTGASAIIDTPYGRVGYFYLGSTLPAYRRRGLQDIVFWAVLLDARQRGCHIAMVETAVGSASGRNAERLGFQVAYTKTFFLKKLGARL